MEQLDCGRDGGRCVEASGSIAGREGRAQTVEAVVYFRSPLLTSTTKLETPIFNIVEQSEALDNMFYL